MRSLGSISSELCEMQRLRDENLAVSAKDAEWQRRIAARNPSAPPPPPPPPDSSLYLASTAFDTRYAPRPSCANTANATVAATLPTAMSYPSIHVSEPLLKTEPAAVHFQSSPSTPSSPTVAFSVASSEPPSSSSPSSQRERPKKPRPPRGVGKIRRHRMTKEEEARFDPRSLVDLRGSTAAKSRKMTDEERDIMLHKRRLRNRASAARSRDKQRKTIGELGEEVDVLLERAVALEQRCGAAEREILHLRMANEALKKENVDLKSNAQNSGAVLRKTASTLRFSMSSDMLDKIISGNSESAVLTSGAANSGLMKIPSKLHLSLSTDKLSDSVLPASGALPPISRNLSFVQSLLDYANINNASKVQ